MRGKLQHNWLMFYNLLQHDTVQWDETSKSAARALYGLVESPSNILLKYT